MINAASVQAILLGSGGFLGTVMAGVGFYRLCSSIGGNVQVIPEALKTMAAEMERTRIAIEGDRATALLVVEMGATLKMIQEDIGRIKDERSDISKELRIISRKIEGVSYGES